MHYIEHSAQGPRSTLKTVLLFMLPLRLQHIIKKLYYPYWIKNHAEHKWDGASVVSSLVKPGEVAVDVGANIGYVTYLLAGLVGPGGMVHSVEPIPETFDILKSNMRKLKATNVSLHHCGLSNQPSEAIMEVPADRRGRRDYYQARIIDPMRGSNHATFAVQMRTLDELLKNVSGHIGFIKIDVEDHELEVIASAKETITAHRPIFMIESGGDPDDSTSKAGRLIAHMKGLGYAEHVIDGSKLVPRERGVAAIDYFFLPASISCQS